MSSLKEEINRLKEIEKKENEQKKLFIAERLKRNFNPQRSNEHIHDSYNSKNHIQPSHYKLVKSDSYVITSSVDNFSGVDSVINNLSLLQKQLCENIMQSTELRLEEFKKELIQDLIKRVSIDIGSFHKALIHQNPKKLAMANAFSIDELKLRIIDINQQLTLPSDTSLQTINFQIKMKNESKFPIDFKRFQLYTYVKLKYTSQSLPYKGIINSEIQIVQPNTEFFGFVELEKDGFLDISLLGNSFTIVNTIIINDLLIGVSRNTSLIFEAEIKFGPTMKEQVDALRADIGLDGMSDDKIINAIEMTNGDKDKVIAYLFP
jgi:hypothetical protein